MRKKKELTSEEMAEKYKKQQEYQRDYRIKNKERLAEFSRNREIERRKNPEWVEKNRIRGLVYYHSIRRAAIEAYGGMKCACCGETIEQFLTIDHINNDGAEHRKSLGRKIGNGKGGSATIYTWLKNNNYPPGFQVLCMNCNHGKSRNKGVCPHKTNGDSISQTVKER